MKKWLASLLAYLVPLPPVQQPTPVNPEVYYEISSHAFVIDDGGASFQGFIKNWPDGKEFLFLFPDRLAHLITPYSDTHQKGLLTLFEMACNLNWGKAGWVGSFRLFFTFTTWNSPKNVDEATFIFGPWAKNTKKKVMSVYKTSCKLLLMHNNEMDDIRGYRNDTPLAGERWTEDFHHRIAISYSAKVFNEMSKGTE